MPFSEKSASGPAAEAVQCQTALVTRIALFLRLLTKENFQRLVRENGGMSFTSEGELLKLMISKRYIRPKDVPGLKKTCLSFARAQKDTRFGSLCIEFGFLTQSNLNLALEEQKNLSEGGRTIFLGDLLVEAGMLSLQQQKLILQKQKMDISFQENSPVSKIKEIREKDVTLFISEDGLRVHALKTDQFDALVSVDRIKDILEKHNIIYGIADDTTIEEFLTNTQYTETRFELARGLEPVPGKDAQIFYLFEQNYLSAGQMEKDGSIDYKSRGRIPFVSAQEILAEKVPPKAGKNGVNVFGDVVEADPPMDIDILCGKGAALSQDKLTAVAQTEGYPKLDPNGTVSVNDAHVIRGDVDYTTGHVKYSKNVFITGTIKSGFKVEAKDVVARAVDGGIIHAKGDVSVANGITNAQIFASGCVSAGFVHRSTIGCLGDMDIGKEVVESRITLEGTFEMSRGKMYASTVSARGGAKIYHIGSIKAVPSSIEVGVSSFLKKQLKHLNQEIEKAQNQIDNKMARREEIEKETAEIDRELERLTQKSPQDGGRSNRADAALNNEIIRLRSQKITLEKEGRQLEKDIKALSREIKKHVGEKFSFQHQSSTTPPRPILDVRGRILTGTAVRGKHSNTVISRDLSRVRIMEMSCAGDSSSPKKIWEMVTNRL